MVSCLQKIYAVVTNKIDDAMFLSETPRPYATCQIFEGFRFANSAERGAHDCFNQV